MYKWRVVVYLSCHDRVLDCIYHGDDTNSDSVAKAVFQGKADTDFVGLRGWTDNSNIFIRVRDIAAFDISPLK
jgi:hypothetical protein